MVKKTVFIVSHTTGIEGPIDYYESYLLKKNHKVIKLTHPLDRYKNKDSELTINRKKIFAYHRKEMGFVSFLTDLYISLKTVLNNDFEIYIGANNFDVLPGIVAKYIFKKNIKKIIFFASDFSENRFNHLILDYLYRLVERISLRYSDKVISNTKRAEKQRIWLGLTHLKSLVIPNCIVFEKQSIIKKSLSKNSFIYVGNVTKEHGLLEFIEQTSILIKELVIIGQGDQLLKIKKLCIRKKINCVIFHQKKHRFIIKYLNKFRGFGLAPYTTDAKWTHYCFPLKVVEYIACGLPVIMSDIPEISLYIKQQKLGIVYHTLNHKMLKKSIQFFDTKKFNNKATKLCHLYDCNQLYKKIPL